MQWSSMPPWGSTNLLLHIPAIAHAAGFDARPWRIGYELIAPLLALWMYCPMDPLAMAPYRSFLRVACLKSCCICVSWACFGWMFKRSMATLGESLEEWKDSERRQKLRERSARIGWH